MRTSWILLLLTLCVQATFTSCRKHKNDSSIMVPRLPGGNDSTPGVPGDPVPVPATYNHVPVYQQISDNAGGFYEALPPSYDSSDERYPLLVFLHGGGELGDGSPEMLHLILKNAVPKRLDEKTFPVSFTVDGQTFSFIIICPQFKEWPQPDDVHAVIRYALDRYRVDSSRIYLSGLSMGGGATWEYAGSEYGNKLAAIVPICGASWADSAGARQIAANKVPAWAFHNEDDEAVTINSTKRYARLINAEDPLYSVKVTYWPTGGHDAWTKASDPEYREDGKNMYEWMLQFIR